MPSVVAVVAVAGHVGGLTEVLKKLFVVSIISCTKYEFNGVCGCMMMDNSLDGLHVVKYFGADLRLIQWFSTLSCKTYLNGLAFGYHMDRVGQSKGFLNDRLALLRLPWPKASVCSSIVPGDG